MDISLRSLPDVGMRPLKVLSGQKPREIAAHCLLKRNSGSYIEQILERELADAALSPADRRLCQELVYGVVRWQGTLDWLIDRKTDGRPQKVGLLNVLRLGLYQLFWMDRIPSHAAVHESVELAKQTGFGQQSGFVNAILRGYVRQVDDTRQMILTEQRTRPHIGFSHPEWLVRRWVRRWGEADATRLLEWNNTPPANFARVNTLKTDPGTLLKTWREEENVDYDFVRKDWLEEKAVFELKSAPSLAGMRSFQTGCFYVQDPSTLLAVRLLDPRPGESVLDMCAAPGGKLTAIGQLMGNEGRLVAHEVAADRVGLIRENCERLGVKCEITGDFEGIDGTFDKILLDAPCSNSGVLRRRVDLRWRIREEELARLTKTQIGLLIKALDKLRPGGRVVYSTCSLEPEENGQVIVNTLAKFPEFKLVSERELFPPREGVDGAYVAVLGRA